MLTFPGVDELEVEHVGTILPFALPSLFDVFRPLQPPLCRIWCRVRIRRTHSAELVVLFK